MTRMSSGTIQHPHRSQSRVRNVAEHHAPGRASGWLQILDHIWSSMTELLLWFSAWFWSLANIYSASSPVIRLPLLGKHSPSFTERSWIKVVSLIRTHVPRRLVLKGSQEGAGRAPPWSSTRLVSTASRGQRSLPQGFQGIGASWAPFWAALPGKEHNFPAFHLSLHGLETCYLSRRYDLNGAHRGRVKTEDNW